MFLVNFWPAIKNRGKQHFNCYFIYFTEQRPTRWGWVWPIPNHSHNSSQIDTGSPPEISLFLLFFFSLWPTTVRLGKCYKMGPMALHSWPVRLQSILQMWKTLRQQLRFIFGNPGAVSRDGRKGAAKRFKHRRKSPWVPTLTRPFPMGQANAGSWLGTQNVLYHCAQSANSFSWVLFVSSYTTAIDSITACLAHAPKKCTQSGNFQFDINSPVQNTVYPKTKDAFPKIQAWAYNKYSLLHRSRLLKYSGV